jgi:Ca2+-binding RTX toxin-like protein
MTILDATQAVNTQTLAELKNVTDGVFHLGNVPPPGGWDTGSVGSVRFVYPNAATLSVTFTSATSDFTYTNEFLFSSAHGTVTALEVRKGASLAYQLSGFDPFTLDELYAEATSGLKTFPEEVFAGKDTLNGSPFGDTLFAFDDNDIVRGFGGNDTLGGGDGNDNLSGGDGEDAIDGGTGTDVIAGDLGADRLTGGINADRFSFDDGDSQRKKAFRDVITDFSRAEGDKIDLEGIDAKKGGVDNAFRFIGKKDFHGKKGELNFVYKAKKGDVFLQGDTDGNGKADFVVVVEDNKSLKLEDFDI